MTYLELSWRKPQTSSRGAQAAGKLAQCRDGGTNCGPLGDTPTKGVFSVHKRLCGRRVDDDWRINNWIVLRLYYVLHEDIRCQLGPVQWVFFKLPIYRGQRPQSLNNRIHNYTNRPLVANVASRKPIHTYHTRGLEEENQLHQLRITALNDNRVRSSIGL